ncbi:MAG: hypothetical protein FWE72_03155 [Spirochaetaceae bacterium]|nr:hypothetical protein [Spirochaetaceae bacterium]
MISIKQIKKLEEKVFKTVELIKALKQENKILKSEIESANKKIEELEQIISDYRSNQVEFEEGIANAIKQLDELDNISATSVASLDSSKSNAIKKEESSLFQNNSTSLSDKEDQPDEEVEEIKINYSKITQNRPVSNSTEKKPSNQSAQNETAKSDNNQLDIF